MRHEIKKMHADARKKQFIIVALTAIATAVVFLAIDVLSG
jgi:hypothetical protein